MENYVVLDQIGEGSFGRVFKGRRKYTGEIVAIKMINKLGQTKDESESFLREITILKKVNHPNIMQFLDIQETPTDFCLITELARGDLFQIISDNQTLPESALKSVAIQLLSALNHLHQSRIIHRDMKPQNILIGANGCLKIGDFGFARALSCNTLVLTSIKGTPLYMAPELVQEKPYDEKVDVWSLGIILYELYFGKPPFYTNSIYKLIQLIVTAPIPWPNDISDDFKELLLAMLQKDPNQRASCERLLQYPFITKPSTPLSNPDEDDLFSINPETALELYRIKHEQFAKGILEAESENFTLVNDQNSVSYDDIIENPTSHSADDIKAAVHYILEHADSNSPLSQTFAFHFTDFISNSVSLDEALQAATILLRSDPQKFINSFQSGISILGSPDMPPSALDFFIELLIIPATIKRINALPEETIPLGLDNNRATHLKDRLLSFLFSSSSQMAKTYSFIAFLAQASQEFLQALCASSSVMRVIPMITPAVASHAQNLQSSQIQKSTKNGDEIDDQTVIVASAFCILSLVVAQNNSAIQYIQQITSFLDAFLGYLTSIPKNLGDFCVFATACTFLDISFTLLSQLSEFQRRFGFKGSSSGSGSAFLRSFLSEKPDISEKLLYACLNFSKETPHKQKEYLIYSSVVQSPLSLLQASEKDNEKCLNDLSNILPMHQAGVLDIIFELPFNIISKIFPKLIPLFSSPVCQEPLAELCLHSCNDSPSSSFFRSLYRKNSIPFVLSSIILELFNSQHPVPRPLVTLVLELILSTPFKVHQKVTEIQEDFECEISENDMRRILKAFYSIQTALEPSLIITEHLARISSKNIPIIIETGGFELLVKTLKSYASNFIKGSNQDFNQGFKKENDMTHTAKFLLCDQGIIEARTAYAIANIFKYGIPPSTNPEELHQISIDLMTLMNMKEIEVKRGTILALANIVFYSTDIATILFTEQTKTLNLIVNSIDDLDLKISEYSTSLFCNLVYSSNVFMQQIIQAGVIEKIIGILSSRKELGSILILRLPAIVQHPEAKRLFKNKRSVINVYTKPDNDQVVIKVAQSIIHIIDS